MKHLLLTWLMLLFFSPITKITVTFCFHKITMWYEYLVTSMVVWLNSVFVLIVNTSGHLPNNFTFLLHLSLIVEEFLLSRMAFSLILIQNCISHTLWHQSYAVLVPSALLETAEGFFSHPPVKASEFCHPAFLNFDSSALTLWWICWLTFF